MDLARRLIKANYIGIRDYKESLTSQSVKKFKVITSNGKPVAVNLPYSDIVELVDILEELADPEIVNTVLEARKARKKGGKEIPIGKVFSQLRKERKS